MNISRIFAGSMCMALALQVLVLLGCRIDSADNVIRDVPINVGGVYSNNGGRIITQHTGAAITSLNIIQNGSELQGVDNNGQIFRGSIGSVTGGGDSARMANFTLRGATTSGQSGIISGTFSISGSTATMRGTWAEPTLLGNVLATATVATQPEPPSRETNTPGTNATGNVGIGFGTP